MTLQRRGGYSRPATPYRFATCGFALFACAVDARDPDQIPGFSELGPGAGGTNGVVGSESGAAGLGAAGLGAAGLGNAGSEGAPLGILPDTPEITLQSDSTTVDLGDAEVGTEGNSIDWVVSYDAENGESSGPLYVTNSNFTDFRVSGCETPLASGESCALSLTFAPQAAGARTSQLTLTSESGATTMAALTGNGRVRLTLSRTGTRAGSVISPSEPSIECGESCTALFDAGTSVTLSASTENGSDSFFSGFSDAACEGPRRSCTLTLDASKLIEARFSPLVSNLAFVSSEAFPASLGSVSRYDAECNLAASAAGINNAAGNAFIAAMSENTLGLRDRLIGLGARGWSRMDGLPIADTVQSWFDARQIYHPVKYTERGGTESEYMMLGTNIDGGPADNCENWSTTSPDSYLRGGSSTAGPFRWLIALSGFYCADPLPLLCLGVTRTAPLVAPTTAGKRIWLTNGPFVLGSMSPDARCTLDRPVGVERGVALLAYESRAASSVLATDRTYVRPDGQVVGTGAQIIARKIKAGIWQQGNGSYPDGELGIQAWTGQYDATLAGNAETTCNNWELTTGRGTWGLFAEANEEFWVSGGFSCSAPAYLYCVEP